MAGWSNYSYHRLDSNGLQNLLSRTFYGSRKRVIVGLAVVAIVGILGTAVHQSELIGTTQTVIRPAAAESTPEPTSHNDIILALGPPKYESIREFEKTLPQHNLENPFPEGKTGRYVKFSNQIHGLGWNNCFNEVLMNAHLAYMSNRAYVFQDYYWAAHHYFWPEDKFFTNPPRTPLNAIIAGPTAGGLWEAGDYASRSISEDWFEVVCPQSERRLLNTKEVKPAINQAEGADIFEAWRKILDELPERCVEVIPDPEDGQSQTFDLWLWGGPRIVSLWESFVHSPTSRLLETSPLVNSAIDRNEYLIFPHGPRPPTATHKVWDRVMAMHVRRGDYIPHCQNTLVPWNVSYYGWSQLPFLVDPLKPLSDKTENDAYLMDRCLPSAEAIVKKARQARADYIARGRELGEHRTLDILYLLTNDHTEFMDEVKASLMKDGWNTIRMSRDLVLDQEQTDVNMAIDMDIARRAAVFTGNGWSSYTSNIIHRRLKDGKEPISIRFF